MLDGGFYLHRKWYGLLEGVFFSWLPCGTESCTDCRMVTFICTESGTDNWKVFFFSWFPCGTEGDTDCWMVAFLCTESGTDFWKRVFLFVVPVWH